METLGCVPTLWWFLICILAQTIPLGRALDREMTINIEPGKQECFFQEIQKDHILDLEYQVIDGGQGDLDVNFYLYNQDGIMLISEYRKADSAHRRQVDQDGVFQLCWDNSFSHFSAKTVFFELTLESDDEQDDDDLWDGGFEGITAEDVYEMKINDIEDAMNRVRTHLTKVRHVQDQLRAFEARDRNIAEGNFTRVNSWSMLQIFVMVCVGIIQKTADKNDVVMVRSLFDDKSRLHPLWRKADTKS